MSCVMSREGGTDRLSLTLPFLSDPHISKIQAQSQTTPLWQKRIAVWKAVTDPDHTKKEEPNQLVPSGWGLGDGY